MLPALVASRYEEFGAAGGTTAGDDTSGADLIVVHVWTYAPGDAAVLTDNKSNTGWSQLPVYDAGNAEITTFYKVAPNVGSGHTFTVTGAAVYPSIAVFAFSGMLQSSPLDAETGVAQMNVSSLQPGAILPSEDNCVLVSLAGWQGPTSYDSMTGGFTVIGSGNAGAAGYLIQTTATSVNPNWIKAGSSDTAAAMACFKSAEGGTPELEAGTASFVSSGPDGIEVSATDADGGTPGYTCQWQRSDDGGDYADLENGDGVSGATTLTLVDGSAVPGVLYRYRLKFFDSASPADEATSNIVTAQVYTGGVLSGGGGGSVFGPSVFA